MPVAPLAKAHLAEYIVQSSDVLAEMRVNVLEGGTEKVLWYKNHLEQERTMTEDEIIESVMDSATNSLRWTIHRPKRGWYLRLRSPSFPASTFIPLVPPTQLLRPHPSQPTSPPVTVTPEPDGTLTFSVRTASSTPEKPAPGEVRINISVHSYPPTPPAPSPSSSQTVPTPSPRELNAKLRAISSRGSVMRFSLYPSLHPSLHLPVAATVPSSPSALFSRALSYLTPTLPIRATTSFTLLPASTPGDVATPLLTFTDRTPTFSVLTTGLLEVNKGLERQMGVEPAFWIAVALAYLEFLAERDSYLAAANG